VKIGVSKLTDRVQTGKAIYEQAQFYQDLGFMLDLPMQEFFNRVKKIPYVENPETHEFVKRPQYILSDNMKDCKSAAVLIGAYLEAHGIPWRLIAISEREDKNIHHVFPQAFINGEWKNLDATYPEYMLFGCKPMVTAAEELPR